MLTNTLLAI